MHHFHSSVFVLFMMRFFISLYDSGNRYIPISIPGPCMSSSFSLHVLLRLAAIKYQQTGKLNQLVNSAEIITPPRCVQKRFVPYSTNSSLIHKHEEVALGGREKPHLRNMGIKHANDD